MINTENTNLYLDIYALESVPPSCINRDDAGQPKTAVFGGTNRARVSSQAWKHAMRQYFDQHGIENAFRTKRSISKLSQVLQQKNPDYDEATANFLAQSAILKLTKVSLESKKKDTEEAPSTASKAPETNVLLSISPAEFNALAESIIEIDQKDQIIKRTKDGNFKNLTAKATKAIEKSYNEHLLSQITYDQILFGRMVASNTAFNLEATAQVAHAISVNTAYTQYDYFVAMDDLLNKDANEQGAAMIDDAGFNSSTLYRYSNLNLNEIKKYLAKMHDGEYTDELKALVSAYLKAFLLSMPSGKENSFANTVQPQYILCVLRSDTPVNLVNAYEKPIETDSKGGYLSRAVQKLEAEYNSTEKLVDQPVLTIKLSTMEHSKGNNIKAANDLNELINTINNKITE